MKQAKLPVVQWHFLLNEALPFCPSPPLGGRGKMAELRKETSFIAWLLYTAEAPRIIDWKFCHLLSIHNGPWKKEAHGVNKSRCGVHDSIKCQVIIPECLSFCSICSFQSCWRHVAYNDLAPDRMTSPTWQHSAVYKRRSRYKNIPCYSRYQLKFMANTCILYIICKDLTKGSPIARNVRNVPVFVPTGQGDIFSN